MHHRLRWASALALAASVLLAACGSDTTDTTAATAATDTTGAAAQDATSSTAGATASTGGSSAAAPSSSAVPATTAAPAPAEQRVEIVFANGAVVGGPKTSKLATGTPVVVVIRSDVADEVHLHGYDIEVEVKAGTPAELRFEPDIPGVFEIEFHDSGKKLGEFEIR